MAQAAPLGPCCHSPWGRQSSTEEQWGESCLVWPGVACPFLHPVISAQIVVNQPLIINIIYCAHGRWKYRCQKNLVKNIYLFKT